MFKMNKPGYKDGLIVLGIAITGIILYSGWIRLVCVGLIFLGVLLIVTDKDFPWKPKSKKI